MKEVVLKQTRGGQGLFQWESVKTDRYKGCYLGSSVKANGGGRYAISHNSPADGITTRVCESTHLYTDLEWYKKTGGKETNVEGELEEIKRLEAEAFAEALGYSGPKRLTMATQQVSKQELKRAITKEARAEERADRMQGSSGLGFDPNDPTKKEDVRDTIEAHMIGKMSDRPVSLLTGKRPERTLHVYSLCSLYSDSTSTHPRGRKLIKKKREKGKEA